MIHKHYFDGAVILKAKIICSFPITLNVSWHCLVSSGKPGLTKNLSAHQKASPVNIRHRKLKWVVILLHATGAHLERIPLGIQHTNPKHSSFFPRQLYKNPCILPPGRQQHKVPLCLLTHGLRIFVIALFIKPLSLSPKIASSQALL